MGGECVKGGTEYIGTHVVQFIVEAASVAHRLSVLVPPPQGGGGGLAVGAARTLPPGGRLKVLGLRLSRTCCVRVKWRSMMSGFQHQLC